MRLSDLISEPIPATERLPEIVYFLSRKIAFVAEGRLHVGHYDRNGYFFSYGFAQPEGVFAGPQNVMREPSQVSHWMELKPPACASCRTPIAENVGLCEDCLKRQTADDHWAEYDQLQSKPHAP